MENQDGIDWNNLSKEQVNRIYKMVSCTGKECHFISVNVSKLIKRYDSKNKFGEFGSLNKMEKDFEGNMIKERCGKLKLDRLGNIRPKT